ncbi:transglutaminase-like domain-containing protein [Actinomyces sp. Marseille-P3109]|uniref:transglutaminase-like domain-containing protein n=1 Tax=Actinomyces sp. Marseille-P3109 TaxID=2083009 RepID=UPI000D54D242|nr:transglutaminase-like domain-containing protein [Actinomyces sp. Marseille-P3109]
MTPTTTPTTWPPRTAGSPASGSPAEAPSQAAGQPSARSPESSSSWLTATSSRTRSLYSTETTRPARSVTGAGPLLARPSRPALSAHRFLPPRRGAKPPTPAVAALELTLAAGIIAVGAVPFLPVFASVIGCLAVGYGALIGGLTAFACSRLRLSVLPSMAALALVHVLVAPWLLTDVGSGLTAVKTVLAATVTVWRDALTVPMPLSSFSGMTVLPWLAGLVVSALATRLILAGREVLAGLSLVLLPVVGIGWGGQEAVRPTALGVLFVAGILALWTCGSLRQRRSHVIEALDLSSFSTTSGTTSARSTGDLGRAALRGAVIAAVLLIVTSLAAMALTPAAPASRTVVRDLFQPPLDLTEYASPLSLVRTLETDKAHTQLMKPSNLPKGGRIRIAAMDSYDGLSAHIGQNENGQSRFERIGDKTQLTASRLDGKKQTSSLTIEDYSFPWVPTMPETIRIESSGPRQSALSEGMYYDKFSSTGIATSGLAEGDVLTERVAPYTPPSEATLNKASIAQTSLGPIDQVPSSVASLAKEIVGAESNPIAQVRALQQRLRTSYYSDGTQSPSQPGHGAARIASMVEADSLIGDDEQYSVLMMLMCRSLNIPARVVMGFDPATDGDAKTVTGEDVKAWVEIPFEGLGWVSFDVTPDRDQVPQQQTTQKVSNPEPNVLQPPLPNEDPAQLPPNYEDPQRNDPQDDDKGGLPTAVIVVGGSILAIAAVVGSVLGWKAWRRSRRRGRTGVGKALGAWEEILDRARDLGRVPGWGVTRREAAAQLAPHFPQADLPRFAGAVDTQVFSSGEPASYALGELWESSDAIVRSMGAERSRLGRAMARLSPRSLVHPAGRRSRRPRRLRS